MTSVYRLRVEELLATNGRAVVAGLLLIAVVAGSVAGYAFVQRNPEPVTVTERTNVQTVRLTVNDSALVTTNETLWPAGTRLHDRPVYLVDAMPRLTVTARTSVPAHQDVTVRHRVVLDIRAVVEGDRLWSTTVQVASEDTTVSDGTATIRTRISIPSLRDRLSRIRDRAGVPISLNTRLRVHSHYATGRYNGSLTTGAPLSIDETVYTVGRFQPATRTHAQRVTREIDTQPSGVPRRTKVGTAIAVIALLGAGGAALARRHVDDPEDIQYRLDRARLAEWISDGQVPKDAGETTVTVTSLRDLVDVAIDANRRVIHDEWRGVYAVLDDDTVYEFDDPGASWDTTEPRE